MKNFKDEVELFSRDTREVLKAVLKFVCFFLKKKNKADVTMEKIYSQ